MPDRKPELVLTAFDPQEPDMKLNPDHERLISRLHRHVDDQRHAVREIELAMRQARTQEAYDAAAEDAARLLREFQSRTTGKERTPLRDLTRPGWPLSERRKKLREKARAMRSQGASFGEIAKALNIPRATAQRWTQDAPKG